MSLAGQRVELKRFNEIVRTLGKYGLADWLGERRPEFVEKRLTTADGRRIADLSREERIREALTELGTTFIKLGQVLSTRADLVGPKLAKELEKLQADTPADAPEVASAIIEEETGAPIAELFAAYEPEALASASVAQVHAARLEDGTAVVVKVQHEGADDRVKKDLAILARLADLAAKRPELEVYSPVANAAEFRKNLLKEMDFSREANNLRQVGDQLEENSSVRIPKAFPESSGRRVLTMERLDGYSVADVERMKSEGVDRKALAKTIADLYVNMIFRDGLYHADPHPGNILVMPEGQLGILDFGSVGRIDEETREEYAGLVFAALGGDPRELTDALVRLCELPHDPDVKALRADVSEFCAEYLDVKVKDLDLGAIAESGNEIVSNHHMILPSGLTLLLKVLVQLEGTTRLLDADYDLASAMKPYFGKAVQAKLSPKKLLVRAQRQVQEWDRLADAAPRGMHELLERLRTGEFDIQLKHRDLDGITNRLVTGILAAALFLGSVQLWTATVPPMVGGYSLPAVAGLLGSVFLGVRLLRAVRRTGDLGQLRR